MEENKEVSCDEENIFILNILFLILLVIIALFK